MLAQVERGMIEQALSRHQGNRTQAAQELRVSHWDLLRKIRSLGLEDQDE